MTHTGIKAAPGKRFLFWINERWNIKKKRDAGQPAPWTTNKILANYRFCNVRRLDDKVSSWLLGNWYLPNFDHENALVACCLARFINQISTLEALGYPKTWNPKSVYKTLDAADRPVFNAAYIVTGEQGVEKIYSVVYHYIQSVIDAEIIIDTSSMENTWKSLLPCVGFGSFAAGQVVADLRWAMEGTWRDKNNWAPKGPGSIRGMNRLRGRLLRQPIRDSLFLDELREVIKFVDDNVTYEISGNLEAIDYQNCLCEFDKFERGRIGKRRIKRKYP